MLGCWAGAPHQIPNPALGQALPAAQLEAINKSNTIQLKLLENRALGHVIGVMSASIRAWCGAVQESLELLTIP